MANPQQYFLTGSSIALRLIMSGFHSLISKSSVVLGRLRLLMGTATGLALTYTAIRSLTQGESVPLVRQAECRKRLKKAPKKPVVVKEVVEEQPRHGLTPRPDESIYLDLALSSYCQPSVVAQDRAHALFLTIRVKREAEPMEVACCMARIQQYVQEIEAPTESCCGDFKILAGVGFGPEFYQAIKGGAPQPFTNSKHSLISSSSVGGDILVHAKSNDEDLLKQLSKSVLANLPKDSVLCYEETYAKTNYPDEFKAGSSMLEDRDSILNYQYTKGDMKLFPPTQVPRQDKPWLLFVSDSGTLDTEPKREMLVMDLKTGGSYVMTQRWVHDVKLVNDNGDLTMNEWVDKAWEECCMPPGEKKYKSPTMLLAELADVSMDQWMTEAYKECLAMQEKHPECQIICSPGVTLPRRPFRILRQSLPYTNRGGETGLFFVSYASTPRYNELLLERLVHSACGGGRLNNACQNVFRLSRNVSSACWYFPGVQELMDLE